MTPNPTPTVLIVPGLRDHVENHWQTLLERKLPNARSVPPLEHDKLNRAARVAALDAALAQIDGPVILVAHSAGVMITVHWAQLHRRNIKGALLATPPDFNAPMPEGYPAPATLHEHGWMPTPRTRLPFPSIVAASTNDPLARIERVEELAQAWGSRFIEVGAVGHLNPASGHGEWPRAEEFVAELS
ncbi:alpha/beta hydrolase [Caballeronia terrestris]|jgi:predicted alpha/beta hydrolase family esterase|uniref:Alpha/beta hydrolase n=1 Tax=Caballeronia terrestris TaxID=1226301 RepID=A0A158L0Q8_9BURK|nr:alpha/beta hydrolase [Caballeronia terrestris]SAL86815.1 alpha/beta hydrolase [Caballeronia terrestris]